MSTGYDAALLLLVVLLPGAFAAWGFERHVQRYGRRLKDWLLRLAGLSAVCLAVGAWPLHWVVSSYWDDFTDGNALPWFVYLAPVAYLAVPAAVGWWLGLLMRSRNSMEHVRRKPFRVRLSSALRRPILQRVVSKLPGPNRAPTAWDALFEAREPGFIRCRLRSGAGSAVSMPEHRLFPPTWAQKDPIKTSTSLTRSSSTKTRASPRSEKMKTNSFGSTAASSSNGPTLSH